MLTEFTSADESGSRYMIFLNTNRTLKATIGYIKPGLLPVIILLVLLQLIITLFTNGFALSADEAMWHYIGRNWFRHGLAPYAGGIDNKSPLFYVIFGISDRLFGVNYWFPRVLGTICQSAGICYIYRIALRMAGLQAGMLAVSFYGLSVLWHCADGRYVSYTETYDVLFILMSIYFFLKAQNKKEIFISGLLGAAALGFRLSAVFGIATIFGALLRKSASFAMVFCCGVLSGIMLIAVFFVSAGIHLQDVYTYALADNYGAGSTTDHSFLWRMEQLSSMFFYSELVLFYPLMLVYIFIKRNVDWVVLWLLLEFIGISIVGNYARVQLKDLLPALALMNALTAAHIIRVYNIPAKQVFLIIWICFFPKLLEPLVSFKKLLADKRAEAENCREPFVQPDEERSKKLGYWIRSNTGVHEKVLVAGYGALVQVYTERLSPGVYFNVTQTRAAKERFFKDLQQHKPEMILIPLFPEYKKYVGADLRSYVDELVQQEYYFDRCMYSYNVYKRRI